MVKIAKNTTSNTARRMVSMECQNRDCSRVVATVLSYRFENRSSS